MWRKAFDGVERRVGPPLTSVTSSPDLLSTLQHLLSLRRKVSVVADVVTSQVLHVVGLPSHADLRALERHLTDLEREVVALRRNVLGAERDRNGSGTS
jgi:hypothetical protein